MEPESLFLTLLRKEDFLMLTVQAVNLHMEGDPAQLVRTDAAEPALLIYHFPPQHVAEEAFLQNQEGTLSAGPLPVRGWLANASRLAFRLPAGVDALPLTLEALLDWRALEPALPPNALPPGTTDGPAPAAPGFGQTALELPAGLLLSPDASGGWLHDAAPHERDGRYALWQTRLGRRDADAGGNPITVDSPESPVRVVWSTRPAIPFVNSLTDTDRAEAVTLSGDFTLPRPPGWAVVHPVRMMIWRQMLAARGLPPRYIPRPARARRLILSALGAWTNLESEWDYPLVLPGSAQADLGYPTLTLEQWTHQIAQGRDQYARTVQTAFVCDPGHRISIVTVTERQFQPTFIRTDQTPGGPVGIYGSVAYLRQYEYFIIQQQLQDYIGQAALFPNGGRELPYRRLRITMRVSPIIDPRPPDDMPFWPTVGGRPLVFPMIGEDWDGRQANADRTLLVVPLRAMIPRRSTIGGQPDPKVWTWSEIINLFNGADEGRRTADVRGQSVAFAANNADEPGKTRLDTQSITTRAQATVGVTPLGVPPYLPRMQSARVTIPAVNQLLGREESVAVAYDATYLSDGFSPASNPGEVFIKLVTPLKMAVAAEKAGGLARPEMGVEGLSRNAGAVARADAVKTAQLDLSAFKDFRLLGLIEISKILAGAAGLDLNELRQAQGDPAAVSARLMEPDFYVRVPVMASYPIYAPGADPTKAAPIGMATRLVWKPEIKSNGLKNLFEFKRLDNGQFYLIASMTTLFEGGQSNYSVKGALERFALTFVGSLSVNFAALRFESVNGRKPDVSAEGVDLVFEGPLTFVNTLRNILPTDGFSDPPYVTVDGAGILAGYTLAVPSLGIGIFSLQNLALSAQLSIPFIGKPAAVRFAVSERHKPFLVSVTLFGGGGFFAITVSSDGLEQIEAAIEFGGNLSLNLGVASGGVYVMAGIYFSLAGDETKLTGYLRCGGYLSVLGLISISIEFYLGFTFRSKVGGGGEVWGQASVKVAVKVAFFSTSVTLTVERRFAGAAGDPTFEQVVAPDDWQAYCAAFA